MDCAYLPKAWKVRANEYMLGILLAPHIVAKQRTMEGGERRRVSQSSANDPRLGGAAKALVRRSKVHHQLTDNTESENDEEESTEAAHGSDEGSAEKSSELVRLVSLLPGRLGGESAHGGSSENLDKDERGVESNVGVGEDLDLGAVGGEVDLSNYSRSALSSSYTKIRSV